MLRGAAGYARRIEPVLFAPELERRSAVLFGQKGNPILPTDGLEDAVPARVG